MAWAYAWTVTLLMQLYGNFRKAPWSLLSLAAGLITKLWELCNFFSLSTFKSILNSWATVTNLLRWIGLIWSHFFPLGHLTISGDIIDCHNLGTIGAWLLLWSSEWRPGMMIQQCTGPPSTTKNHLVQNVSVPRLRNSALGLSHAIA